MARFTALAFALIAVSLLLFQPICEAGELRLPEPQPASHATAAGGGDGDSCCSIVAAAPLQSAAAAGERPGVAVPQPTRGLPTFRPEMLISGAVASPAPLPVPRYHARSARSQR